MGLEMKLADTAREQGVDEAQLCKTMADLVRQVGANMPK